MLTKIEIFWYIFQKFLKLFIKIFNWLFIRVDITIMMNLYFLHLTISQLISTTKCQILMELRSIQNFNCSDFCQKREKGENHNFHYLYDFQVFLSKEKVDFNFLYEITNSYFILFFSSISENCVYNWYLD